MYQVLLNHWHLNLMTVLKSLISFFFDLSIKNKNQVVMFDHQESWSSNYGLQNLFL